MSVSDRYPWWPRYTTAWGRALRWVAVLVVGAMASGCGPIMLGPQATLRRADAIVVLGNRPVVDMSGRIRPEVSRRVRTGVALFRAGVAPIMVMAGGPAPGLPIEADIMARYARALGVPDGAIRRERRSRDTVENAANTVALLCRGSGTARCRPRLILVSSPFHLRRARDLFICAGAEVQTFAAPAPNRAAYRMKYAVGEHLVRLAYAFGSPCRRARAK